MSKRKGLSFEEKREKMLEIFTETSEFFNLKELEKICPKKKGIISQSVKEVVQSLVDDNMICSDKCGTQTVYWCFPSDKVQKKKARISALDTVIQEKTADIKNLEKTRKQLAEAQKDGEQRVELLSEIKKLEYQYDKLKQELNLYSDCDPATVEELFKSIKICYEAANRWTDNIFNLKAYCEKKFGMQASEFFKNFNIPDEIDYLSEPQL